MFEIIRDSMQKNGLISTMSKPLLEINQLSVDFVQNKNITTAIENIQFTISRGEWVAIVGESGSGKSVTALSVLRLIASPPAFYKNGSIVYNNKEETIDLLTTGMQQIRNIRGQKIAMIFQEPMSSLNPIMTCGRQVTEAIKAHLSMGKKAAKQKALALFQQVQLPDPERLFYKYPHELSGGQKQRVMIAMAMSCQPDLLICDEPITALDATVQKILLDLLQQLQITHQMALLFISHDLGVVKKYAQKVMVMYKGKIVESNTSDIIFSHPSHPYTKALLACRPSMYLHGQHLPLVQDLMEELIDGSIIAKTYHSPALKYTSTIAPISKTPILRVQQLNIRFPIKRNMAGTPIAFQNILHNIHFEVYTGEILGVAGESGCGKSTLAKAIMQIIPVKYGSIHFNGMNLSALSSKNKHWRKEIQMVFQDPYTSLNSRQTIGETIVEPMKVHGLFATPSEKKEHVLALLEKVKLNPNYYSRYPKELSGGQRQRVVIARALAVHPSLIIFDESVAALDVSVQAQILNLINDLKNEFNFTGIFISHDMGVVKYISDRIMVMNKGRIEEIGTTEQIFHHPTSAYTQTLINAML